MKCFVDGDQICIVRDDFVDLQESPAFFIPLDSLFQGEHVKICFPGDDDEIRAHRDRIEYLSACLYEGKIQYDRLWREFVAIRDRERESKHKTGDPGACGEIG